MAKHYWHGVGNDWESSNPKIHIFDSSQYLTNEQLEKQKGPDGYVEMNEETLYFSLAWFIGEAYLMTFTLEDANTEDNTFVSANVSYTKGDSQMIWEIVEDKKFGLTGKTLIFYSVECYTSDLNKAL